MPITTRNPNFSVTGDDGSIVRQADGTYIALWATVAGGSAIKGQAFNADGTKKGGEFTAVTGGTTISQLDALTLANGDVMITWKESGAIKLYKLGAQANSIETVVIDGYDTPNHPKLYALRDGGYGLSYQAVRDDGVELYVGRIAKNGQPVVDTWFSPSDEQHSMTVLADGSYVLIHNNGATLEVQELVGDFRDLDIARTQNDATAHHSINTLAGGGSLVIWHDIVAGAEVVKAQRVGADYTLQGMALTFAKPAGTVLTSSMRQLSDGSFVFTVTINNAGDENVYVATCDEDYANPTTFVSVGQNTAGDQADPTILDLGNGVFAVSWTHYDGENGFSFKTEIFNGSQTPNHDPTDIKLAGQTTVSITENSAFAAALSATDADGDPLIFAFDTAAAGGGNAGGMFTIDNATGQLKLAIGKTLDFETARSHTVYVKAFDGKGGESTSQALTINVTDVAEKPPGQVLVGRSRADVLKGGAGDDRLYGKGGKDVLTGREGLDVFVFDTKPAKANLDRITDYSLKDDTIWLDNKHMTKLGKGSAANPGKLKKANFTYDKAKDVNDYLVYNKKTGILSYDKDGSGSGKGVEIVVIGNKARVTADDFLII